MEQLKTFLENIIMSNYISTKNNFIYYNKCEGGCLKRAPLTNTHSYKCCNSITNLTACIEFYFSTIGSIKQIKYILKFFNSNKKWYANTSIH